MVNLSNILNFTPNSAQFAKVKNRLQVKINPKRSL